MQNNFSKIFDDWEKTHKIINKDEKINDNDYFKFTKKEKDEVLSVDLHYLTRKEALEKLKIFIISNQSSFLKKVIIIHGAGNHSKERSVLKESVIEWLKVNNNLIKYFRPGQIGEGRFGVTVAYINPK